MCSRTTWNLLMDMALVDLVWICSNVNCILWPQASFLKDLFHNLLIKRYGYIVNNISVIFQTMWERTWYVGRNKTIMRVCFIQEPLQRPSLHIKQFSIISIIYSQWKSPIPYLRVTRKSMILIHFTILMSTSVSSWTQMLSAETPHNE